MAGHFFSQRSTFAQKHSATLVQGDGTSCLTKMDGAIHVSRLTSSSGSAVSSDRVELSTSALATSNWPASTTACNTLRIAHLSPRSCEKTFERKWKATRCSARSYRQHKYSKVSSTDIHLATGLSYIFVVGMSITISGVGKQPMVPSSKRGCSLHPSRTTPYILIETKQSSKPLPLQ